MKLQKRAWEILFALVVITPSIYLIVNYQMKEVGFSIGVIGCSFVAGYFVKAVYF